MDEIDTEHGLITKVSVKLRAVLLGVTCVGVIVII